MKHTLSKRILSILLCLCMVLAMLPMAVFAEDTTTVYFQNNWLWTDVCAYYWNADGDNTWPGTAMTFVENDGLYDIYSFEVPAGVSLIINGVKNDGTGERDQTPTITDIQTGVYYFMTWDSANACNAIATTPYIPPVVEEEPTEATDSTEATEVTEATDGTDTQNLITINMTDSYGDGWNGSAIEIYEDGELVDTATIENGASATWTYESNPTKKYTMKWVSGNYDYECSFEILLGEEVVLTATTEDCGIYAECQRIYPACTNHSYDEGVVTAPTCTVWGYTTYTCALCGHHYTAAEVDATGHTPTEGSGVVTAPTCTTTGYTTYTCATCGDSYNDDITSTTGHSYGADKICTACGAEYSITIKMKDTYGDGWNNGAIEIYEDGVLVGTATIEDGASATLNVAYDEAKEYTFKWVPSDYPQECSFEILLGNDVVYSATTDDCNGFTEGQLLHTIEIACDHSPVEGSGVVTAPTCTEDGYTTYTCATCGGSYTADEVAATGHSYGDDDVCDTCGYDGTTTFYLYNDLGWGTVYAYAWDAYNNALLGNWPGTEMTLVEGKLYSIKVPNTAAYIIFNNTGTNQTGDLTIPTDDNVQYSALKGSWGVYCNHSYGDDNVCDTCGFDNSSKTIYFCNDIGWGTPYAYFFNANNSTVGAVWPGTAMTLVEGNLYSIEAPADAVNVIFNNGSGGSGNQTADLTIPTDGRNIYTASTNSWSGNPQINLLYPSVSFQGEIRYNIYFEATNRDDVVEFGLILFNSMLEDGTIYNAEAVFPGADRGESEYMASTDGIPAKNMADTIYFKVYAKLSDGSYIYSEVKSYSALEYAYDRLENSTYEPMRALAVAMLNYGAAAQEYFGYNTDNLMNAGLTDEQKALISNYSSDMVADLVTVDSAKVGDFAYTAEGFSTRYPSVFFKGEFAINYYFKPAQTMDSDMTLYYWDQETYYSSDVLTAENASGTITMTEYADGLYTATYSGISAKDIDQTVFVAGVYESNGVTYSTGVLAYSVGAYCVDRAANSSSEAMQALAEATAVYGYYAKSYFNG